MKVKRRTVWFLTLLSLAAVISVYYLFEPTNKIDFTTIFSDGDLDETILTGVDDSKAVESDSYVFEEMRMEIDNERSQLRDQLVAKMASEQYSAEEKNEAFNDMNNLIKLESSEAMLEMLIKSLGYSDTLVRIEGEKVAVSVMTNEISPAQANEIVYIVRSELEDAVDVSVKPQSSYY
ncbi:SpoIIIAH-like family protein [Lysinibacillus sp. 54212]|uniref:SpoIIIAH-like family protein n=1 Tax=Lysinibacillus sp. 54212 TaxID=3119829 RepID=UPI002FC65F17